MTKRLMVGDVAVGGGAPVSIQSMCNTKTDDVRATVEQIHALEAAGCVLERSEPYVNRGASRYVRVYIDAEKPAADGGAREIEEG